MPAPVWQTRRIRCLRAPGFLFCALTLLVSSGAFAQSSIGVYSDVSGNVCTLAAPASGMFEVYVVVRPGPDGATGVEFAALKPACLAATYLGDQAAPNVLTIGDSQNGITVALQGCKVNPVHALTIQYMATGATPACCAYPIGPDPAIANVVFVDCAFREVSGTLVTAHFNADGSCPCGGNSIPNKPDQPSPPNGATFVSIAPTLGWLATDYDDNLAEYDVYLGPDPAPPLVATVTEMNYTPPAPLAEYTQYHWRVVARDSGGLERSSDTWVFTTRGVNSPPYLPIPVFPPNNQDEVVVDAVLNWYGEDVDGDSLTYDVYFGASSPPPLVVSSQVANMFTPPALAYLTQYFWRIVARDPFGNETSGAEWKFTTRPVNHAPIAPTQPSPANNALNRPATQTLSWWCFDADNDTLRYDVYVGTAMPPPLAVSGLTARTYAPGFTEGQQYYWRVVAHDPFGEVSGPTWTFTTIAPNIPPIAPHTPAPVDSAVNVAVPVSLYWSCSDPDGNPLKYDVYWGTVSPPPLKYTNLTTRSVGTGVTILSQRYYWRVVARDSRGGETSGPEWTYRTRENQPPNPPFTPTPADQATGLPVVVQLRWHGSDPENQTLKYDVYFGTASPPPLIAVNQPAVSYSLPALQTSSSYHWKIVARDTYGAETAGPEWSFTIGENLAPYPPADPIPADHGISSTTPTLSWTGSDPNGQVLTYDVYFGKSNPPPLVVSGILESYYTTNALEPDSLYYWRVVASDGELSTSGPIWWFEPRVPTGGGPARVVIASDLNGYTCSLQDHTAGTMSAYVILFPYGGATGVQFSAPKPGCYTGQYLGDAVNPGFLAIGNTQTGITIALTACLTSPVNLVTIQYAGLGTTPPCCMYPVLPDPTQIGVVVVDCNFAESFVGTFPAVINEDPSCPCGADPVLIARFDATYTGSGVDVRWELAGDEAAVDYTLSRRTGSGGIAAVVSQGAVTGTRGSHMDTAVQPGMRYGYELTVRTADGTEFQSPVVTVETRAGVLSLGQNHPNPFNPTTTIPYTLPGGAAPARVRLLILDVSGAVVRTLVDAYQAAGTHEAVWNGRDDRGGPVSSGIYFSVLDVGGKRDTRKMVLLK